MNPKKIVQLLLGICFYLSTVFAYPGQLIDANYNSTLPVDEINIILWMAGMDANAVYDISIYDILYETEGETGYADTLGGLVIFPIQSDVAFPIMSYQHGTILNDNDAPSIAGFSMDNAEVLFMGLSSAPQGFITLFPDYEGIGNEDYHPYIIEASYTHAVVNMIRATKELSFELNESNPFQFNDQLHLIGYSEGGYATMAAQKGIEESFSDELTITSSHPMAGPYDLAGTMVDVFLNPETIYPNPYYVPYVLTSHLWYYEGEDVDFHEYFETVWADTLPILYDGTHSSVEVNEALPSNPLDILLPDVLEEFTTNENHFFRLTLEENTLLDWTPQSPTFIYHGEGDDNIPVQNAQVAYDAFIENGSESVELILFNESLGGHASVAPYCLVAGFNTIQSYAAISPKGDMNSDGLILEEDLDLLIQSVSLEPDLTEFQWWAGDLDFDNIHSIFDILLLSELIDE